MTGLHEPVRHTDTGVLVDGPTRSAPGRTRRGWPHPPLTLRTCTIVLGLTLLGVVAVSLVYPLQPLAAEDGPLEEASLVAWLVSALMSVFMLRRGMSRRDRLNLLWLGVLAALAFWRESDGQDMLIPATIGHWGLHYRIDWWLSRTGPILPRLLWLVIGGVIGLSLLLPLLVVRPDGLAQLRRKDAGAIMFVLGIILLGIGWACDDVFGRGQFISELILQPIEETSELLGSVAFLLAVLASARAPLSVREGKAESEPRR